MVQLRRLSFRRISLPSNNRLDQPNGLVLRNLGVLNTVLNFKLSEEVCTRIPHIKNLGLTYQSFKDVCDEPNPQYCPYNLERFHKLESLNCSFSVEPEWHDFVLSLTLPSSLKKLSLTNSRLEWEEMTMIVGSLPCLENLSLYANSVIGSEWTLVHEKFPCLKSLMIDGCSELIYWNVHKSHFPVLEEVTLEELSELDEFPSSLGEIPTFRSIALRGCSVSSAVSALKMLVEQEEEHANESIKLEVSFNGDNEKLLSFWEKMEEDDLNSNNLFLSVV